MRLLVQKMGRVLALESARVRSLAVSPADWMEPVRVWYQAVFLVVSLAYESGFGLEPARVQLMESALATVSGLFPAALWAESLAPSRVFDWVLFLETLRVVVGLWVGLWAASLVALRVSEQGTV